MPIYSSVISEGSVWLIVGIAVAAIAVMAILIVKKVKASKKKDNEKE